MNRPLLFTKKMGFLLAMLGLFLTNYQLSGLNIHMDFSSEETPICLSSQLDFDKMEHLQDNKFNEEFFFMDDGCCDQGSGKPQKITLRYTGEDCSATSTAQDDDKVNCSGNPNGAPSVFIIANDDDDEDKGDIWFSGNVSLNGTFTIDAENAGEDKLSSNTFVHIFSSQGGSKIQELEFHTSCSQPLFIGDQFGSLILEGLMFEDGTSCDATGPESCPDPSLNISATVVCPGESVVFSTDDLGFPCFTYSWNFGPNASPQVATGIGPHTVSFNGLGAYSIALTVDNGCDGGGSGSGSGSSGSSGSGGSGPGSGSGSGSSSGGTICGTGGGSSGSSGSSGSGGSVSSGSSGSSGSNGSGSGCIDCRETITATILVSENCEPEVCPDPIINIPSDVCAGEPVIFSAPDLGFPCLTYAWTFGVGANPPVATGLGPHSVTYASSGSVQVSLTIDNGCDGDGNNGSGSSGSSGDGSSGSSGSGSSGSSGSGSSGSSGSGSGGSGSGNSDSSGSGSSGSSGSNGSSPVGPPVICPDSGSGGSNGNSGSGGSGSGNSGSSGSGSSGSNGSGSNGDDCCDEIGKPAKLVMQYTGEGCDATNTNQSSDKWSCSGSPNNAPSVYIVASDKEDGDGDIWFSGNVALNDTYVIDAGNAGEDKLSSATFVQIFSSQGGSLLQEIEFHTSCSQPLASGSQWGANRLLSIEDDEGDSCEIDQNGSSSSGSQPCVECRNTTTITLNVEDDCEPNLLGKIGDRVWRDDNGNGIQDDGEPGIPNVWVLLFKCDQIDNATAFRVTDANGMYMFNDLEPGCYRIRFSNPGLDMSPENVGDDCADSDMDFIGFTEEIDLGPGEEDLCVDAGFVPDNPPCSVNGTASNIVCDDNGTPSPNDDTYSFDLTVTGSGTSNGWNTTINGQLFTGSYNVPINLGPYPILAGVLTFDVQDNDNANCDASLAVIPPAPCSDDPGPAKLGDMVWNDIDQDGTMDNNEPGVGGVTVTLRKCDGTFVDEKTTGQDGKYLFEDLAPNMEYFVVFGDLPPNFVFTTPNVGNDGLDSDVDPNTGQTDCVELLPGDDNRSVDAGIFQTALNATLGDKVFEDLDQDGQQDSNEPGVSGILVTLKKCDGSFVADQITGNGGEYLFENLAPNMDYKVMFSNLPANYVFTTPNNGNDNLDSDVVDFANGETACVTLNPGEDNRTVDAGIYEEVGTGPGKIGDFVWDDLDADGIQDDNEPGLAGVYVVLETCDHQFLDFRITNSDGMYMFNDLDPGQYKIRFANPGGGYQSSPGNQGANDEKDSDIVGQFDGRTACFTVEPGEVDLSIDGGFTKNQPPDPVCEINGDVSNVQCDDNGTPNNPDDDTFTFDLTVNGSNTGDWGWEIIGEGISYNYGETVTIGPFNISSGSVEVDIKDVDIQNCIATITVDAPNPCSDGGGCDNVTDGGSIIGDETNCGGFDPEPIVQGNPPTGGSGSLEYLWLSSTSGCPTSLTQAISGANSSSYDPPFISETTYFVRCVRRVGCTDWTVGESNCVTKEVDTGCGGSDEVKVGDRVWIDENENGIQDNGEPGLQGVWIFLQNQAGLPVPGGITVSDEGGAYEFSGLAPGTYRIKFANPGGFFPTAKNAGNDPAKDSDISFINGTTDYFQLNNDNLTIDAGFISKSQNIIGNTGNQTHENGKGNEQLYGNSTPPIGQVFTQNQVKSIKLFPNPASGYVEIQLSQPTETNAKVEIFNSLGQLFQVVDFENNTTRLLVDLTDFENGQYLVRVKIEGGDTITKPFIINKN